MAKQKELGTRTYVVLGSTIEYGAGGVVRKSYTTPAGKVVIKNGTVHHPDGTKEPE